MHDKDLKPGYLLVIIFAWIIPYIFLANYLERALLPFRALCYTQPDLLSVEPLNSMEEECIRAFHPNNKPDPECYLHKPAARIIKPSLDTIKQSFNQVIVVRTAPASTDYREFIRTTWKTHFADIPVIFAVAKKDGVNLSKEATQYDDIVQFDFIDSYYNLAYKMMSIYGYVLEELPFVENIIVVNDDVIVNSTAIRNLPTDSPNVPWVLGKVSRGYPRLWMPWLTWHVPGSMYSHMCYPLFTQGSSFIISKAAATVLLQKICRFPNIHLDDIQMGVMCSCLGIEQRHNEGFDHHTFDQFVVYHYQYSRHSADYLRTIWSGSQLDL